MLFLSTPLLSISIALSIPYFTTASVAVSGIYTKSGSFSFFSSSTCIYLALGAAV